MANRNKQDQETFLDKEIDLQQQYSKVEEWINENRTKVVTVVGAILLLVIAVVAFRSIYLPGQEKEAQEEMWFAQSQFEIDSFNVALNGDGTNAGFLDIIGDYSGFTKSVDLANYYAGVCYLNMGDYQSAIDHFGNFGGNDEMVSSMALGQTGDAYMELGETSKGISFYKKAAKNSDNGLTAPMFYIKAGMAMEKEG
ncbi:MAG: tetratricopeptide repeat protein, partial [Chitinophagales bacterium]